MGCARGYARVRKKHRCPFFRTTVPNLPISRTLHPSHTCDGLPATQHAWARPFTLFVTRLSHGSTQQATQSLGGWRPTLLTDLAHQRLALTRHAEVVRHEHAAGAMAAAPGREISTTRYSATTIVMLCTRAAPQLQSSMRQHSVSYCFYSIVKHTATTHTNNNNNKNNKNNNKNNNNNNKNSILSQPRSPSPNPAP